MLLEAVNKRSRATDSIVILKAVNKDLGKRGNEGITQFEWLSAIWHAVEDGLVHYTKSWLLAKPVPHRKR
jgi:hypothetical protein